MCRFVGYLGGEIRVAELISDPANSLIRQSYKARERREPLNGDGFGVGWYPMSDPLDPCLFTGITPAWSNRNFLDLARHTRSGCFFSHIRAASPGMRVSEANCHPFRNGRFLWMHNGTVEGFSLIKRRLRESLPDRLYDSIEGSTDSEHAFAVFLNMLGENIITPTTAYLADALVKTVWQLEEWTAQARIAEPSISNFAVTDGRSIAAIRYVSNAELEPVSLYVSRRGRYQCCDGCAGISDCCTTEESGVIIASERLTDRNDDWTPVAPNHVLSIDTELNVKVQLMPEI